MISAHKQAGRCLASLVSILLAAGCSAPAPAPDVPVGAPADFPQQQYARAAVGETLYAVDTARSLVQVRAYRSGALARLGHDHVIASRDVSGFVRRLAGAGASARFSGDMYLPLAAMTVDEPALRAAAGFDTTPSEEDREGTRGNMLKSLDAAVFPFARVTFASAAESAQSVEHEQAVDVTFTLHGVAQSLRVPVNVKISAAGVSASGTVSLAQSDFGVAPFSVLGGALAVQDTLDIRFDIYAVEIAADSD